MEAQLSSQDRVHVSQESQEPGHQSGLRSPPVRRQTEGLLER